MLTLTLSTDNTIFLVLCFLYISIFPIIPWSNTPRSDATLYAKLGFWRFYMNTLLFYYSFSKLSSLPHIYGLFIFTHFLLVSRYFEWTFSNYFLTSPIFDCVSCRLVVTFLLAVRKIYTQDNYMYTFYRTFSFILSNQHGRILYPTQQRHRNSLCSLHFFSVRTARERRLMKAKKLPPTNRKRRKLDFLQRQTLHSGHRNIFLKKKSTPESRPFIEFLPHSHFLLYSSWFYLLMN